jgi:hypothetical protein
VAEGRDMQRIRRESAGEHICGLQVKLGHEGLYPDF